MDNLDKVKNTYVYITYNFKSNDNIVDEAFFSDNVADLLKKYPGKVIL